MSLTEHELTILTQLATVIEAVKGLDEKFDMHANGQAAIKQDHETRIRNLEVFRNWSAGVGAAIIAGWAVVTEVASKYIGT